MNIRAICVGIDASLTGFAWTALENGNIVAGEEIETAAKDYPKDVLGRIERYNQLCKSVVRFCNNNSVLVLIENYSFGSKGQGVTKLGELGGILRYRLSDTTDHLFELAPPSMKKFATGKGNKVSKLRVVRDLEERYDVEFETDNKADSFCAAKIGECLLGYDIPQTKFQYEALAVIQKRINEDNPYTFANIEKIRLENTLK